MYLFLKVTTNECSAVKVKHLHLRCSEVESSRKGKYSKVKAPQNDTQVHSTTASRT